MRRPTRPVPSTPWLTLARRRVTVACCTAAQLISGACTSHRPVSPGDEPARANVRVRFAAPRVVAAVAAAGDTLVDSTATEVEGVLAETRGDTLVLRGQALTPAIARMEGVRGPGERRVRIVRHAGDAVTVHRFSAARTAGLLVGGAVIAGVAFFIAVVTALGSAST